MIVNDEFGREEAVMAYPGTFLSGGNYRKPDSRELMARSRFKFWSPECEAGVLITLLQYLAHVPLSYIICCSLVSQLVSWLGRWLVSAPSACFCHEEEHHTSYLISEQGRLPTSRSWDNATHNSIVAACFSQGFLWARSYIIVMGLLMFTIDVHEISPQLGQGGVQLIARTLCMSQDLFLCTS